MSKQNWGTMIDGKEPLGFRKIEEAGVGAVLPGNLSALGVSFSGDSPLPFGAIPHKSDRGNGRH